MPVTEDSKFVLCEEATKEVVQEFKGVTRIIGDYHSEAKVRKGLRFSHCTYIYGILHF